MTENQCLTDAEIRNLKPLQSLRTLTRETPTVAEEMRRLLLIPPSVNPSDVAFQDLIDALWKEAGITKNTTR